MASTPNHQPRVLVAYGSKNGGTAGIAEIIGTTLLEDGLAVDVLPADRVKSVDGYQVVIIGGALYANHWHRDARRFARRYAASLRGRPVWSFSSGPLDDSASAREIPPVPQAAEAARALQVRQHVTFGGQLTDTAKGFVARAMVRNGHGGDFRDPERIRAWARSIATTLQSV
jgi:menaquinone-dependent protoporphyrinogen oxidase